MKPSVISNANSSPSAGSGNPQTGGNSVTIPVNHEYQGQTTIQQPHFNTYVQDFQPGEAQATSYRTPNSLGRGQRQQQSYPQQQNENPTHFQQNFDFEPDVDMDMFPRTRLGRMTHDPFGDFASTTHFGFPQFNSLGRRRINPHNDDDFFNRLPSEFRQYIPESFTHRRTGSSMTDSPISGPTIVHEQQPSQQQPQSHFYSAIPQPSPRKLCDAAIQTEDSTGRSEVDHLLKTENLKQHGLRNTMDMGVKSRTENEHQSKRSSSAPPTEQQNLERTANPQIQQIPGNASKRQTPPRQQHNQFATQTSPQIQSGSLGQSPQFHRIFHGNEQQAHPHQKQPTPPPQTPGGTNIRTIPIFVEGRTEPIINNKEIPTQNIPPIASCSGNSRAFTPPKSQAQQLAPLNTQEPTTANNSLPPQTPDTLDTINKIQDIQRDVLDLMSRVEQFKGTRADKEYVYLDEMLTRNLLKLDNIDTNGKESIRLARKEAIKCIQASINVLEAKAEENKKASQVNMEFSAVPDEESVQSAPSVIAAAEIQGSSSAPKITKEPTPTTAVEPSGEPADAKVSDAIPLPPPESEKFNEVKIEDCPEDDISLICVNDGSIPKIDTVKKGSPSAK